MSSPRQTFQFGAFLLDAGRGVLFRDRAPLAVGHRRLLLLRALLEARGQVVTKADLMDAVWPNAVVEESNLSVQIASLRKVLGTCPDGADWISTVPRIGYRFAGPVIVQSGGDIDAAERAADPARRPSIAVLPFINLSGDPGQEHFADGITEDIIAALSRFRWFFVVARNSSFVYKGRPINVKFVARELGVRYVLEGSVRRSAERVRISAHLIDAANGNQLFASRRDLDAADILTMQDQIAERVAGAMEPELLKAEASLAATRLRAGAATGWDLARHGIGCLQQATKAAYLRGRELLLEACGRDPDLPEAHIWLAHASAGMIVHGWGGGTADAEREAIDAALKALQLDDKSPYAHYALAISSAYQDAPDQAVRAAEKAVELCPALALAHLVLGLAYLFCGDAGAAIGPLERGLDINPHDSQSFLWCSLLALAYLFDKKPDAALERAEKALKIHPAWRPAMEAAACCSFAAGRAEMGRQCVARMTSLEDSPCDVVVLLKRRNPRWGDEMAALLCTAEHAR